jgi:hypothetical protein
MKNRTKAFHDLETFNEPGAVKQAFEQALQPDLCAMMRTLAQNCRDMRTQLKAATSLGDDDRQWLTEIKSAAEAMLAEIRQTLDQPTASEKERLKLQTQSLRLQTQSLKMRARLRGLNH